LSLLQRLPVDGSGKCIADLGIGHTRLAQLADRLDELAQRPLLQVELAVGLCLRMYEGAAVALGFDDLVARQQLVRLRDRLAVEVEIVCELADRRQGVAGLQYARRDRGLDLLDELLELRDRIV